jgi:sec-independent protein translocase protein TatC
MNAKTRGQLPREREEEGEESREGRMGFLEHLEELRKCLIRSCIAIAVGMAVGALFIDRIANFVLEQIERTLPAGTELIPSITTSA